MSKYIFGKHVTDYNNKNQHRILNSLKLLKLDTVFALFIEAFQERFFLEEGRHTWLSQYRVYSSCYRGLGGQALETFPSHKWSGNNAHAYAYHIQTQSCVPDTTAETFFFNLGFWGNNKKSTMLSLFQKMTKNW